MFALNFSGHLVTNTALPCFGILYCCTIVHSFCQSWVNIAYCFLLFASGSGAGKRGPGKSCVPQHQPFTNEVQSFIPKTLAWTKRLPLTCERTFQLWSKPMFAFFRHNFRKLSHIVRRITSKSEQDVKIKLVLASRIVGNSNVPWKVFLRRQTVRTVCDRTIRDSLEWFVGEKRSKVYFKEHLECHASLWCHLKRPWRLCPSKQVRSSSDTIFTLF